MRERIAWMAALFVLAAVVLGLALERLAIAQHDSWLTRSYLNRWAFRDVPTRRGDVVDRRGVRIAWDEPGIDLEFVYRTFRRRHPVAAAVHGANLVARARHGAEAFSFTAFESLGDACGLLLSLPIGWLAGPGDVWLRVDALPEYGADRGDISRDVRFYAGAMVAGLGTPTHAEVARVLARAVRERWSGDVAAALRRGLGHRWFDVERRFAERLDELRAFDARLATLVAADDLQKFDLFDALERRRHDWLDWCSLERLPEEQRTAAGDPEFWRWLGARVDASWRDWLNRDEAQREDDVAAFRAAAIAARERRIADEEAGEEPVETLFPPLPEDREMPAFRDEGRPRILRWRLPYGFAVWLGGLAERHPGFLLRPSVVRDRGTLPDRDDLGSFESLLGFVSNFWATDEDQDGNQRSASGAARDVLARVVDAGVLAPPEPDLPEDLEESLRGGAEATLRRHFRVFGRIGRGGVEAACDDRLSGSPGLRFVERGKSARERRMFDEFDVTAGRAVRLSIDLRVQAIAERVLAKEIRGVESALVAMDAQTGELVAVASRTRRHPQVGEFAEPERSLAALYWSWDGSVGSVAKPFVTLEYLESRARNGTLRAPSAFAPCAGRFAPYRTCHHHGSASQDPAEAIAASCNFFFYEAVQDIGRPGLWRAFSRVGWQDPRIPVDGDQRDAELWRYELEVPPGTWQRGLSGVTSRAPPKWQTKTRYVEHEAIGYAVAVSAVDVARAYAGLATGYLPDAGIVRGAGSRRPLGVARENLDVVRAGLRGCVVHGTARRVGLDREFDRYGGVYGKTGTAIIARPRGNGVVREIDNAWFAGFLGLGDQASLVVVAVVYQAPELDGGEIAAPMFREFLRSLENAGLDGYLDGSSLRED